MALVSVLLVGGLVGGATFALFTDSTESQKSEFTAGELDISNSDKTSWSSEVENMAPGDSFEKKITVTNTGSLQLAFAATVSKSGALFGGATPATVEIGNAYGILNPGASTTVTATVHLPLEANDDYQTASGEFAITFHAYQTKNVSPELAHADQTNDNAYNAVRDAYYDGYLIEDGDGNVIPLDDDNVLGMYERRPDSSIHHLVTDGSTDPKLWFNNAKDDGRYDYVLVLNRGAVYYFAINHVGN